MTLLEVLFSMGIVSVGLLGTILLIPLAAHQAKQGTIADISARVGRNGFNEVTILSYDNPANWLYPNGVAVKDASLPAPHYVPQGQAFCIDARFIAYHSLVAGTTIGPGQRFELFPYVHNPGNPATAPAFPPGPHLTTFPSTLPPLPPPTPQPPPNLMPFMNRITLSPTGNPMSGFFPAPPATNALMGLLQADDRFISRHDLLFEKHDDDTFPPSQIDISPLETNSQSRRWDTFVDPNDRLKRESEGKFSWMLTVAPKVDVTMQSRDLYTMSLIVFYERNGSFPIDHLAERIARVRDFSGLGVGGGEVTLTFADPTGIYDADTVRVRADNWIMLASQLRTPAPPAAAQTTLPVFRWYRVVSTATPLYDSSTSTWTQDVTLHGPDWDRPEWVSFPPADPRTVWTYAAVVNNVRAVYEKTLRLESSSLWTDR